MATGKPLISILMAIYKPNEKWLREQLSSLNSQTYSDLELVIYDDCPECPLEESIVRETVTAFPYRIIHGEKNLGSNKAFERLTVEGTGDYFAYCDQDDVWHADKVSRMAGVLEATGSPLVCSDMAVIDGDGNRIAGSITEIQKRQVFHEGEGLAKGLMLNNFVTGCAMMIRADVAKKAVPFIDTVVHDQWLAINAAVCGRIEVIKEPLIDYRRHEGNQTGSLQGINDKESYFNKRIMKFSARVEEYKQRLYSGELVSTIDELEELGNARKRYFSKFSFSDLKVMIKYRNLAKDDVKLESVMKIIPERLFKKILQLAKDGKI